MAHGVEVAGSFVARKRWADLSCVHRNWKGSDRLNVLHGYARSIEVTFVASELSADGLVVDFSSLSAVKHLLERQFDHTLLVAADDPLLEKFVALGNAGAADVRIVESATLEASAEWVASAVEDLVGRSTEGRVSVQAVEVRESPKNAVVLTLTGMK